MNIGHHVVMARARAGEEKMSRRRIRQDGGERVENLRDALVRCEPTENPEQNGRLVYAI